MRKQLFESRPTSKSEGDNKFTVYLTLHYGWGGGYVREGEVEDHLRNSELG
jgi:hypothetical protein